MVRINWTKLSVEDLKNIAEYISRDSRWYAKIQIQKKKLRTHILKSQSKSGRVVPEIENQNIRELIEGNYRIIYKIVSKEQIDILTVHHSSRDLTKRSIG
jgi:toxin ParE1/3/4